MKIAVFGNYGVKNIGDDLILQGLQKHFEKDQLIVFCGNPDQITHQFGLESHHFFPGGIRSFFHSIFSKDGRESLRRSREALKNVDRIVVGGGGILVDRHLKAIALWWAQLRAITQSLKPFEFLGNSFELKRWWTKKLFGTFFRKAGGISVRDRSSLEFIRSMGLEAKLIDDLSFQAELPMLPRKVKKQICLALCRWGLGASHIQALREIVSKRKAEGNSVVGLAFQTMVDDDRDIYRQMDPSIPVLTDVSEILEALNSSEVALTMRYHAAVLAYRLKVPFVAISYQEKVAQFMADHQLETFCVPVDRISQNQLMDLLKSAREWGRNNPSTA